MYNCLFIDSDLVLKVGIKNFIEKDAYGWFIPLVISKQDVLKLMEYGVTPKYIEGKYIIKVGINNKTKVTINGSRITYFGDDRLSKIPIRAITLKEACLKKYSNSSKRTNTTYRRRECYTEKMIFTVNIKQKRIRKRKKDDRL